MRLAVIENNIITNILNIDENDIIPDFLETQIIPEDVNVEIGDFFINNQFEHQRNNTQQIEYLKNITLTNYKLIKELSQRIFQLENKFFS